MAARLIEAERQKAPLDVLLGHAGQLAKEVTHYSAAAVHDARADGATWDVVAAAADITADTARARWNEGRVGRLLARRSWERLAAPVTPVHGRLAGEAAGRPSRAPGGSPPMRLASALSFLQRQSGVTIQSAAAQADLSPSYVSRVLAGERTPAWPVVHMLATIFEGRAGELRLLWEAAHGAAQTGRPTVAGAAERLKDALRGYYLAAACPDLATVCANTDERLTPEIVTDVLNGDLVPDWETTGQLAVRLGGHPADVRPLWEDLHYAFLASHDMFPPAGVFGSVLPDSGADPGN